MANRIAEFREFGVEVVAISMSKPNLLAIYLAEHPTAVRLFADPERKAYAAFGLGRTTIGRLIHPGVMWRYLKHVVRGAKIRRVPEGEDALQTGGDFLVDSHRRLLWAYRSDDPTDRPSVDQLLHAVHERVVDAGP